MLVSRILPSRRVFSSLVLFLLTRPPILMAGDGPHPSWLLQELETRFPNVVVRYDFNDYHGGPFTSTTLPSAYPRGRRGADNPWVEALDEFLDNLRRAISPSTLSTPVWTAMKLSSTTSAHLSSTPPVVHDTPPADVFDATPDATPVLPTAVVDAIPDAAPVLPAADLDAIPGPPFHDALSIARRPSYNAVYILAGFGVLAFSILATGLQFFYWVLALKRPCTTALGVIDEQPLLPVVNEQKAEDAPLAQDDVDLTGEMPRALQVPIDTVPQPPQTPSKLDDPQNPGDIAPVQELTVLPCPPSPIPTPEPTTAVFKERTLSAPGAILYQSLVAPVSRTLYESLTPIPRNASNAVEILYETPATVAPSRSIYPSSPTILYSSKPIAGTSSVFVNSTYRAPPRSSPVVFHSGRSGLPPAQYGQQLAHAGFAPNAAVWPQPSQYPDTLRRTDSPKRSDTLKRMDIAKRTPLMSVT
ncbi:hypothetical protein B0H13DRAFT_2269854 [Mycena leptocephala]|nr:hypothetical protein B0H13DRAFT_2269854 [Mycena leptocephala]